MARGVSPAEEKVELALKLLAERGPLVVKHARSKSGGWVDAEEKIDFQVYLFNRLALPLQVKRNNQEVELHLKHHPHICAVKVERSDTPETIAVEIEALIREALREPVPNESG